MSYWWYFIPFLLVPILVHLFDFRKAKKLYFSSVKFIVDLTTKTKSKSRLKYFLILTNRVVIFISVIVIIALLFGGTNYVNRTEGIEGVYYDNSVSSSLNNTSTRVENGIEQIKSNTNSVLYFDNFGKSLLDNNSIVSISDEKSQTRINTSVLFNRLNDNYLGTSYLFSDFQSFDVTELRGQMIDSSKNFHLIITNNLNEIRNVGVDSLYLIPNQDNLSELSVLVDFNVFNMTSGSVVVKLMKGERQLSSIVKDVSELDIVRFDISKNSFGDFEIVIDGDDVDFDNSFHFIVGEKVKPNISILKSSKSDIIKAVYSNSNLFDVHIQDPNNLDYDLLKESDLVVISDLYMLPKSLQDQLKDIDFVLFPSDSVNLESYEDFTGVNLNSIDEGINETSVDSKHPLLKGVFEQTIENGAMPHDIALFRTNGNYEPIIEFRGGNAFLLKRNNVYFFNSSIKKSAIGFQSNALFLPILYQIAFSSAGSIETPYYYPGDRLVLAAKASDNPIKLVRNNYEIIPTFNSKGSQVIMELPEELVSGKYFTIQGADTLRRIAINIPKVESDMNSPTLEELNESFADMNNVTVSEIVEKNDNVVFASASQSSLWKYVLILTVFLILTETALHRYLR